MSSLSAHLFFPIATAVLLAAFNWPFRWVLSGTPILTHLFILGESQHSRILSFIPLWTLVALLNLTYVLAATSWLFYWLFTCLCYATIFISSLFQFEVMARIVRRRLNVLLRHLHFINDKVAFFNIPALEFDTEVEGLLVIRGITFSLAQLSLTAHGVEVGIKLSEDTEFALQVDEVDVFFFRRIEIGDVYANLKGGEYEMTFGNLVKRATGDSLMVSDTPLLQAAALRGNTTRPDLARKKSKLTNGPEPEQVSIRAGLHSMTQISPRDGEPNKKYIEALAYISNTSLIQEALRTVDEAARDDEVKYLTSDKKMRAAICSQIHDKPSVPHPPLHSIKVTTLQQLFPPSVRKFLHRLPFLLRLLLNPLSYFHPIKIESVTAAGSGKWLQHILHEKIFKTYGEEDSGIRKLETRVSAWLSDANFVVELVDLTAVAQVPLTPSFDILTQMKATRVLAYRTLLNRVNLTQVARFSGADANIAVPSFLLPHHEHLLPPIPDERTGRNQQKEAEKADCEPEHVLVQPLKDEANVKLSVHASLPAVFDQQLLDFFAALGKAAKVIEMEKDAEPDEPEVTPPNSPTRQRLKDVAVSIGTNVKDSMRRVSVDAVMHDRWIAKMIGKVTKRMETVHGDIGYSGDLHVPLAPYREVAEKDLKLLP